MSVIWRKVWRDLTHDKLRTLLAALSLAAGIFAIGLAFGARALTQTLIAEDKNVTRPANIVFRGGTFERDTFDSQVEKLIAREPGIADVEGELTTTIRWKKPGESEWRQGILIARQDFAAQRVSIMDLLEGDLPGERMLAIERQSTGYFDLGLTSTVLIQVGKSERVMSLKGIIRKPCVLPPMYGAPVTFFATPETVQWLTGREGFNKLYVRLNKLEPKETEIILTQFRDKLERMGLVVNGSAPAGVIGEFNIDELAGLIDAMYLILVVMGVLALGLSAFLIINTMNAIIVQQVWQIGVMKVIGGTGWHLVSAYLMMAMIYGILGLSLGILPSVFAAQIVAGLLLDSTLNIIPTNSALRISPEVFGLQVVVGLSVPLIAALVPVLAGIRLTPRQAIVTRGVGLDFGTSRLDRLMSLMRGLPRPFALSLRNTFRRKARMTLTMIALVLGGVMFMMVVSTQSSFENSVDHLLDSMQYDLMGVFAVRQRTGVITAIVAEAPDVTRLELWDIQNARFTNPRGEKIALSVWGVPYDSPILQPVLVNGRRLLPSDERGILLDNETATRNGLAVGDHISLTIAGDDTRWQIVGLILNVMPGAGDCFVTDAALASVTRTERRNVFMLMSTRHDGESQARLKRTLNEMFLAQNVEVVSYRGAEEFREQSRLLFVTLSALLLTMACVTAIVGGVGLAGMLSINVLERRREIGIMRAIGARSPALVGVFVGEGVCLGILSWLIALPLSYPAAFYFSRALGVALFTAPPTSFDYSLFGAVLWLVIVIVLSTFASLVPALQATRVTVREALAYE